MGLIKGIFLFLCLMLNLPGIAQTKSERKIWTSEEAINWYSMQPWLVGANFLPSSAINQLEMWQKETFNTVDISRELQWAASIGMNTMRIFLHDLAYQNDPKGFKKQLEIVLKIAARNKIRLLLVFFDSCWDPYPHPGKQHEPAQGLHNSGWVQSPGADVLIDSLQYPRLKKYVVDIISTHRNDNRILGWDVWNEPDNTNNSSYGRFEPFNKTDLVYRLLKDVFIWARSANPTQPVTSGIWNGNWSVYDSLTPIQKLSIDQSDIISFHNYDKGPEFEKRIKWLQQYNKPLLCTEYMSRGSGSTFEEILPIAKKNKVAVINWGLVNGKSQTIYPWDSWEKRYFSEPDPWFHDVFRKDGQPYRQSEVDFIKRIISEN